MDEKSALRNAELQEMKLLNGDNGDSAFVNIPDSCADDGREKFIHKNEKARVIHGDDVDDDDDDDGSTTSVSSNGTQSETWSRGLDFILSLLGYAVGLGNLWRFPYLCMRNGGGAFLIPFMFCLFTCGLPLFFLEVTLGQFLGKSSLNAWIVCPLVQGVGIGMIIVSAVFALYYNMITAWTLYYLGNSFTASLPWATCDHWWNTKDCVIQADFGNQVRSNLTASSIINGSHANTTGNTSVLASFHGKMSSEEEFWQYNVLQLSSGLGDFGEMPWHLPLCLLGAWTLVFFCIMKGVHSIGKVVYVTVLLPYVLLTVFFVKGLTLEGSLDGILYYLKPDLKRMMNAQVWVEAALQVFYSLGPGWGPLITMASYNKFNNNCLRDAFLIAFIGEGTSIFCGMVVFTILGFIAFELKVPIEEVVKSGPGLGFIAYPQALARLPVPQLWAVLFFVMLLLVGLDSQFASAETVVAGIVEFMPRLRKRRTLISIMVCVVGFLIGLPMCFQGGMYIFQLVDWYVAIFAIPIFGIIECVVLAWIYGAERYSRDIELMLGKGVPLYMRFCWCFLTPAALFCCFVFTLWTYTPASYGDYNYPVSGEILGWFIASLPLIPLPIVAFRKLRQVRGPLLKRFAILLRPSTEWQPKSPEYQKSYHQRVYDYHGLSFLDKIRVNLFGDNRSF